MLNNDEIKVLDTKLLAQGSCTIFSFDEEHKVVVSKTIIDNSCKESFYELHITNQDMKTETL